ncbi:MAG: copper resistance CopC family protein [Candidatus Rokuibacteriota bacterium]
MTAPRLVAALTGLLTLVPVGVAGHAFLVKSSPARRAVLTQPPARVDLWFNERLEGAYSRLSVVDAEGRRVDRGDGAVGRDDGARRLTVSLPPITPGTYTVRYRVLSVDGHVVDDAFSFTVKDGTR